MADTTPADPSDAWRIRAVDRGNGPVRLAVKDCIDVAGVATTSGSALVAATAQPADADADVVSRLLDSGHRVVAKTNLDEFCFGSTGVNPWFGTPVNPLDPTRIPGGSSSGSAVAVAVGHAEVALGTDTTGSARTPAAFCGVIGLKLTRGAVSMRGVRALAPTLDCLGVLAARTARIRAALRALGVEPRPLPDDARLLRFRIEGTDAELDASVDRALERSGLLVETVEIPGWGDAAAATRSILFGEAPTALAPWVAGALDRVGPDVRQRFATAAEVGPDELSEAYAAAPRWRATLRELCTDASMIVTVSMQQLPPRIEERSAQPNSATSPVSLAGLPAIVGPLDEVQPGSALRASVQVIGAEGSEWQLCDVLDRLCPDVSDG